MEEPTTAKPLGKSIIPKPNNLPYVVAIVAMIAVTLVCVSTIMIFAPDRDHLTLIGLVFAFVSPTTLALLTFMKSQETHLSVNSRLDQFVETSAIANRGKGREEGFKAGVEQANLRTDNLSSLGHALEPTLEPLPDPSLETDT